MSTTTAERISTWAPLRVPAYRRLWAAVLVANLGTFLQMVAAPWLMLELTGSPLMVSLVTASLAVPRLLLTLPAGALADAIDRRILLMIGQWGSALAVALLAVLAWQDRITPGTLLVLSLAIGVGTAISVPAHQTLIPDLVERDLVPAASALYAASFNVSRAIGPAIGGAFVAAGKADLAFGLNAVTYLVVVVALVGIPAVGTADRSGAGVWRSTRAGLRYVRFTRPLLRLTTVAAGFAVLGTAVQTLLPNVVADDLDGSAQGFGLLLGAFGAGALVGALTRERVRVRIRTLLPLAITAFGASGVLFGLSRTPLLSAFALALTGLFWVWTLTTMNATVQLLAPRWVRGRALSVFLLAVLGVQPFGAVTAGSVAESLGSATTVALFSLVAAGLGVLAYRLDLPVLGEVVAPALPEDWTAAHDGSAAPGSPLLVQTTWHLRPDAEPPFFEALREVRRQRLRTGADRWSVFRDLEDPLVVTETYLVANFEEHLAQHQREDDAALRALAVAAACDRRGAPEVRHYAGLDVFEPAPGVPRLLLERHARLHDETAGTTTPEISSPA